MKQLRCPTLSLLSEKHLKRTRNGEFSNPRICVVCESVSRSNMFQHIDLTKDYQRNNKFNQAEKIKAKVWPLEYEHISILFIKG